MKAQTDSLILVVDDDPASLRLTQQILLAAGYWNIHLFADPSEMLHEVDPLKVDLIISDLQMPEIDGFQLLMTIRDTVPVGEFLPVLVITADASTETKRRALLLGADDFLTKPIDVVEMTLRVKHLLQLRSLHTALSTSRQVLEDQVAERTSDLETALERLESLIKAKDVFLASVSHELRTPLTAVLGFANELASNRGDIGREEAASVAQLIAEQAADLSAIIDDLLVAARSEINAVQVLKREVNMKKELDTVVRGLHKADQGRLHLPSAELTVQADHLRVRQILRNLITNALRHGGELIRIEFAASQGMGTVTVIDNGPGISEAVVARLFEPYYHGGGDFGQPAPIGLGLTVSRFLANLMEGDIDLVPNPLGTAFQLSLPTG
jgi:signal transduction histidine kinase